MDMAANLFSCAESFEQIGNTLSTEAHVKSGENCSNSFRKEHIKKLQNLYMYIAQWKGQLSFKGQMFDYN